MKLICPSCGAVASAEAWTGNADARQCLKTIAVMPSSVSRNILPYLSLFRPQYNGAKGYRGLVVPGRDKLSQKWSFKIEPPIVVKNA